MKTNTVKKAGIFLVMIFSFAMLFLVSMKTDTFAASKKDLKISWSNDSVPYPCTRKDMVNKMIIKVTYKGKSLKYGKDYAIDNRGGVEIGKNKKLRAVGIGKYEGHVSGFKNFTIVPETSSIKKVETSDKKSNGKQYRVYKIYVKPSSQSKHDKITVTMNSLQSKSVKTKKDGSVTFVVEKTSGKRILSFVPTLSKGGVSSYNGRMHIEEIPKKK